MKNSGGCAILLLREEIAYEEKSTCNYVNCRVNNVDFGVRKKEKLYEIPDLSQYKTDYVGDSSNVINIVSSQEYPEGYSYDSIEIQSEEHLCKCLSEGCY